MENGPILVAMAGNPNVGKSTLFNSLTGMRQHTGNWAGKTVTLAQGQCRSGDRVFRLVDVPGAYSLMTDSAEEELARDFICFGQAALVVLVCDAGCLERNMDLVLQTMERGRRVLVCVNLMDEAARRGIRVDLEKLSRRLGVPVVGTVAGRRDSRERLLRAMGEAMDREVPPPLRIPYPTPIEDAVERLLPLAARAAG
ncbi:MAG: 50S ribosome-binding GTPase, partial [Oscillospiraceae bacterium]|nr:50S ribosome-binding GTPase [Oscillospiraceae bacterium]